MLTIEVCEEEESEENEEGKGRCQETDNVRHDLGEEKVSSEQCNESPPPNDCKSRSAVRRLNSVEKFQAAVTKVKLGMRVVKSLQFHTTRTVARAVDVEENQTTARRRKSRTPAADLGHFPAVLRLICRSVRVTEQCYLVVELVSPHPGSLLQYFVVLRHTNEDGLKEDMILGVQVAVEHYISDDLEFCVGIPITSKTTVRLEDGDGSFMISDSKRCMVLKPSNIQSQWAAIQFLTSSLQNAADNMYFESGKSHQWCSHYSNMVNSSNEKHPSSNNWKISSIPLSSRKSILEIFDKREEAAPSAFGISTIKSVIGSDPETISQIRSLDELSKLLIKTIREIMYNIDLDDASSRSIRTEMEATLGVDLSHHKAFIEEKILMTLGQMDEPSLIKDYLYLGTEWNACNYEELIDNGVTHVLNVTSEIESCFESSFKYHRVDVLDIPQANMLRSWEETHQFIKYCKDSNGKVLVHCQRGISRSGCTTISYIMREYGLTEAEASSFVKSRRTCVKPNRGFQKQLEYFGKCLGDYGHDTESLDRALQSVNLFELYAE